MTGTDPLTTLAKLAGEVIEASAAAGAASLGVLMHGPQVLTDHAPRSAADQARQDAETEAAFDNMPV